MITLYGAPWCQDCVRSQKVLTDNHIEFKYINLDEDEEAMRKVISINNGLQTIPTIVFDDGTIMLEPSNEDLLKKLVDVKLIKA